jgi:putative membrane protein
MELLLNFLAYFAIGLGLLIVGIFLFEMTTKNKEFKLIGEGNKAAAYALGGKVIGLSIVLYSAIANSISLYDMIIWGVVAIILQIIAFYIVEWMTSAFHITKAIDEDNQAVGLFLLFVSIALGLTIAGSLTY